MSATHKGDSSPADILFVDSLDSEIEDSLKDPQYRAAFEDATHRHELMDRLVRLRKERNLTQKEVAGRMGVGQSTIAGFENEGSDPRLSTVQRYARAVEARCVVTIQISLECDWVKPAQKYVASANSRRSTSVNRSDVSHENMFWAMASARRASFALVA